MSVITVPIIELVAVAPRSRLVSIDFRGHALAFQPGQAIIAGEHGQPERRPYSIAWVGEMNWRLETLK